MLTSLHTYPGRIKLDLTDCGCLYVAPSLQKHLQENYLSGKI